MSYKYINPGYADLCDINSATTSTIAIYNGDNKVSIIGKAAIDLTSLNFTEIWMKFDHYFLSKTTGHILHIGVNDGWSGSYSDFWQNNGGRIACGESSNTYSAKDYNFKTWTTYLLHIKTGSDGKYELWDGTTKIVDYSGAVLDGDIIRRIYFDCDATNAYAYSNIIISDAEITLDEKIAIIPMESINTDWVDNGDGSYSVSEIGKKLLETLDIDRLLSNIEQTNATIKAISINAINASYTSPVNAFTSEVISGNTTQDVVTKALSGTGWYTPAMQINPITSADWTISDLRNIQLGIKSAGA